MMKKTLFCLMLLCCSILLISPDTGFATLTDGLVAYYPFNGNANDESGNGNNGTVYGATLTADRFGNLNSAYYFNGVDNFIDAPPVNLQTGESFTVSLWIKYELQPNRIWAIYFNSDGGSTGFHVLLNTDQWGFHNTQCGLFNGTQNHFDISAYQGQWFHMTTEYDTSRCLLISYLNGVMVDSQTICYFPFQSGGLYIGQPHPWWTGDSYYKGSLDDVRIYNRALSESEIQELYIGNMYSYPVDGIEYVNCPVDSGTAYDSNNPSTWYTMVWTGKYTGNAQDRCEGSGGHPGVDIVPRTQEAYNIKAIGDATVIERTYLSDWGNTIILEHKNDPTYGTFYSIYAHLAAIDPSVIEGLPVYKGQKIGTMGCTGSACQGTHLHFQLDKYLFPVTNNKGEILYYKPYWTTYTEYTKNQKNWKTKSYPANDKKLTIEELSEASENVMFHTINPIWFIEHR